MCVVNRGQHSSMNIGSCRVSTDDHKALTTSSSMKTCVFTPPHETGLLVASIILYARSHDTRLGRESSWPQVPSGTHCFPAAEGQGSFVRLDWESGICVAWTWAIFVMPVDLRARRSTIGCRWSLEQEAWQAFDNAWGRACSALPTTGTSACRPPSGRHRRGLCAGRGACSHQCSAGVRTT